MELGSRARSDSANQSSILQVTCPPSDIIGYQKISQVRVIHKQVTTWIDYGPRALRGQRA